MKKIMVKSILCCVLSGAGLLHANDMLKSSLATVANNPGSTSVGVIVATATATACYDIKKWCVRAMNEKKGSREREAAFQIVRSVCWDRAKGLAIFGCFAASGYILSYIARVCEQQL